MFVSNSAVMFTSRVMFKQDVTDRSETTAPDVAETVVFCVLPILDQTLGYQGRPGSPSAALPPFRRDAVETGHMDLEPASIVDGAPGRCATPTPGRHLPQDLVRHCVKTLNLVLDAEVS